MFTLREDKIDEWLPKIKIGLVRKITRAEKAIKSGEHLSMLLMDDFLIQISKRMLDLSDKALANTFLSTGLTYGVLSKGGKAICPLCGEEFYSAIPGEMLVTFDVVSLPPAPLCYSCMSAFVPEELLQLIAEVQEEMSKSVFTGKETVN